MRKRSGIVIALVTLGLVGLGSLALIGIFIVAVTKLLADPKTG